MTNVFLWLYDYVEIFFQDDGAKVGRIYYGDFKKEMEEN
jgi:hypothetical protein